MKLSIILIASLMALANCQTTTTYCPSGQYSGYVSTAFKGSLSPITGLSITSSNYAPSGIYRVTASNGADQCCYNCATQTSGTCTTWTYDGCGNCYLSSATGSTNYLTSDTSGKAVCSGFASGYVNASSSSTSTVATTTTTTASSSSTTQCQIGVGQNSPNAADSFTNAVSASDCCNKCGKTSGCVGFAYFGISSVLGGCWLKTYNPLAATNIQTYPGMFNGVLTSSG